MIRARTGFDAVRLGDGTVLVVGDDFACHPGGAAPGSERAERYDPTIDSWAEVDSLNKPRKLPATVALADGSAMVIGGINSDDVPFSSTKLFGPDEGTWTDGPLLEFARGVPVAASLPDGGVLVVSTLGGDDARDTSEVYDPDRSAWRAGASLPPDTHLDALLALSDGRVLGVGYFTGDTDPARTAILYDPSSDSWTPVNSPNQGANELAPLPDGGALAIGGINGEELLGGDGGVTARVSRLDPASGRWTEVASLATARIDAQVIALEDGRVLVAGGAARRSFGTEGEALRSTELYDPDTDTWSPVPDLLAPRYDGNAVRLDDGTVLVLGGSDAFNARGEVPYCAPPLTTVERFDPSA